MEIKKTGEDSELLSGLKFDMFRATSAGEAGKGFAVVAEKIRKLADESASSSKNLLEQAQLLKSLVSKFKLEN